MAAGCPGNNSTGRVYPLILWDGRGFTQKPVQRMVSIILKITIINNQRELDHL